MELKNRWAVVTGAGNGIGRGIAMALTEVGASVLGLDVDAEGLSVTKQQVEQAHGTVETRVLDVCDTEAMQQLADELFAERDIALLCNNAGVSRGAPLLKSTEEQLKWIFDVNFFAVWRGSVIFGRKMAERDATAWIVNTGSEHSLGVPFAGSGIYTASKHAVHGLSDVLRREMPDHVGVSLLCPGMVDTTIWRSGERRPQAYGGPGAKGNEAMGAMMAEGMDPLEVGRRVVRAVLNGDFYIFTHSHAVEYAQDRAEAVEQAFAQQAPRTPGDEYYTVDATLARFNAKRNAAKNPDESE